MALHSERKAASKRWYDAHAVTVLSKNGYWKHDYRFTLSVLQTKAPATLIDIGCGPGAFLTCAAETLPQTKLYGLDLSESMVRAASKRLGARAEIRQGDSEEMPLPSAQYDALTCNMSIHHYPHAQDAVNEMYRILKPGGVACINDMDCAAPIRWLANKTFPHLKSGDVKMYRRDEIEGMLLRAGFRVECYHKISPFSFLCVAVKAAEQA